jgi:hypothetical protein
LENYADISVIITFIKRVNDQYVRSIAVIVFELRQRGEDKHLPLVAERQACYVAMLGKSTGNMLTYSRYTARKLYGNACNELAGILDISATSSEEEACSKPFSVKVSAGDGMGNGRLSRTS